VTERAAGDCAVVQAHAKNSIAEKAVVEKAAMGIPAAINSEIASTSEKMTEFLAPPVGDMSSEMMTKKTEAEKVDAQMSGLGINLANNEFLPDESVVKKVAFQKAVAEKAGTQEVTANEVSLDSLVKDSIAGLTRQVSSLELECENVNKQVYELRCALFSLVGDHDMFEAKNFRPFCCCRASSKAFVQRTDGSSRFISRI
jgi:hypothetical protein